MIIAINQFSQENDMGNAPFDVFFCFFYFSNVTDTKSDSPGAAESEMMRSGSCWMRHMRTGAGDIQNPQSTKH